MTQRIGKVTIELHKESYRLRYTYQGKSCTLTVSGGKTSYSLALTVAATVNDDLARGQYDSTKAKYDPRYRKAIEEAKPLTLLEIWELYKSVKRDSTALTSQNTLWKMTDNALKKLSVRDLSLDRSIEAVEALKREYANSTLSKVGVLVKASINLAFEYGRIPTLVKYPFPENTKVGNQSGKIYTVEEIREIIKAFDGGKATRHYARFVEFTFLLGRRPEDIIALEWEDLKGTKLRIDKAYSKGILKGTKNNTSIDYPLNGEMLDCLNRQPRTNKLIFPSVMGKYIIQANFTSDIWNPTIDRLVKEGVLKERYRFYNCRHSRATHLLRSGQVDMKTIGDLLETSPTMLDQHYLQGNHDIELPKLF